MEAVTFRQRPRISPGIYLAEAKSNVILHDVRRCFSPSVILLRKAPTLCLEKR